MKFYILGLVATFTISSVKGQCQVPGNAKCYSISNPIGTVGSSCCSDAQCQPWLEDGETFTVPVDWYCMYIQPLGLNEACDNKKGKCATGLNCIAGFCLNQAIPATTPAVTTPAFTTPAITTPAKNLLFISSTKVVTLPSFSPVEGCSSVPSYPISGIKQVVTGLVNGFIMNCGGFTSGTGGTTYSDCYSLQSGAWKPTPSMLEKRWGAAASNTPYGFLVTGGRTYTTMYKSIEIYNGVNWQKRNDLPIAMESHCQVYVESAGTVIVTGGNTFGAGGADKRVFELNLASGTWSELPSMQIGRSGHSCIHYMGQIWVFGGNFGDSQWKKVEKFDMTLKKWTDGPSLPTDMFYGQAVVYENILYVALPQGKVMMLAKNGWEDVNNIGRITYTTFQSPIVSRNMIGC